ncbi:MAG TPA: GGDEF domain-containing protein [Candidatus Dormibacteraeota bacterium]|nr:GGDEF domain-containing protein [Candidatus Dormibacteraeota bacterium]
MAVLAPPSRWLQPQGAVRRGVTAASRAMRVAGLRRGGALPVVLLAAAVLTVPAAFGTSALPTTSFLGLAAAAGGVLALGIGGIAMLDSRTHHDRRGVANTVLGTALSLVMLCRLVLWVLGVEGRIPQHTAVAGDEWFFGAIVMVTAPVLAWGGTHPPSADPRPETRLGAAFAIGTVLGVAVAGSAALLWWIGGDMLDHLDDAIGITSATLALLLVLRAVRRGASVRPGTRAALALIGAACVAEALSAASFDPYWYAAQLAILIGLAALFLGKVRLLGTAMRTEHQHLWELRTLHWAAQRLTSTLDVQELRSMVVAIAARVLTPPGVQQRRASLFRVEKGRFVLVADNGDHESRLAGASFLQSSLPAWREAVASREVRSLDIRTARIGSDARAVLGRAGLGAQIVAPVVVGGEVVGLLAAGTPLPCRCSAAEIGALRGIATLAGLAFDNAWRYTDEHRLVETLYRLSAANTDAARADDTGAVLERVVHAAVELTGARSGAVVLLDEDGVTSHVATTRDDERAVLERFVADLGGARVAAPIPGRTTAFRVDDVLRTAPPEIVAALHASGVQVLLAVPLMRNETPAGVLYVAERSDGVTHEFGANDEAVLLALAAHAMVSVGNVQMMRRLAEASLLDPLTGLGNRREFDRVRGLRPRAGFAVLAIDVDNLKVVNDEAGHEAGDAVLRAVGATLASAARPDDRAMRVGGDEFCLVVQGADLEVGRSVGERLRSALRAASVPHGQAGVSIGVAPGEPGDAVEAVWRVADLNLYRAKADGRDRLVATTKVAGSAPRWEEVVRSAFQPGGLRTVFQPVVDLRNGAVVGFEALSRPQATPPGESVDGFFTAAQRLGMMRDVDWLCRRTALETAAKLPPGTTVFVNASTGALLDPVLAPDQMELLAASLGLDPSNLVLELTERELVSDLVHLAAVLARYRRSGFRFALDDVGTGRSTLALLVAGEPEFLKIAGNIVTSTAPAAEGLLDAAIAFAERTGAAVVAEGIEDQAVASRLVARGVVLGQGFALFRPMELDGARGLAERGR